MVENTSIDKGPYKYSVLFVCTANQCRSPMAEVLFKGFLEGSREIPDQWMVGSAGLYAYPNYPATPHAQSAMINCGLDLTDHQSQPVTEALLDKYNLILCMESNQKRTIKGTSLPRQPVYFFYTKWLVRRKKSGILWVHRFPHMKKPQVKYCQ